MTRWLPGLLMIPVAYFAWCYYVPSQADRIQQTANLCYRVTSGVGGMLHVPFPDAGDLISGERDNARSTCAGMLYGFSQGAGELARRQQLEKQAQNPALYAPASDPAGDGVTTGANAAAGDDAGNVVAPAAVSAATASPASATSSPAPGPVSPGLPNATDPGSL